VSSCASTFTTASSACPLSKQLIHNTKLCDVKCLKIIQYFFIFCQYMPLLIELKN
jgi:hypothetical protein